MGRGRVDERAGGQLDRRTDGRTGGRERKSIEPQTLTEHGPERVHARLARQDPRSVKMDWELMTMASLHLTATEHRYYGDIFIYCCENADSDSVPAVKVAELLRSANLPRDVTMKVSALEYGTVLFSMLAFLNVDAGNRAVAFTRFHVRGSMFRRARSAPGRSKQNYTWRLAAAAELQQQPSRLIC